MSQTDYSFWSRTLHRLALANNAIAETAFDIERLVHGAHGHEIVDEPHVFVTGLARAGTTILLRQLYRTDVYRSLTYRDMPFVLAPNIWSRISKSSRRNMEATERAHGDDILVDFDSPEALEEVFWRVTSGHDYIRDDSLLTMTAQPDIVKDFRDYVALVLKQFPGKRYLSKNNNNIVRLGSLLDIFPNAAVIIPFREPLQHANSLMLQHAQFSRRHGSDRFSREYMTWLAHHEFGQDHRPFVFDNAIHNSRRDFGGPEQGLRYWLQIWIDVYSHVLSQQPEKYILISYDRLCEETNAVWPLLCSKLSLPQQQPAEPLRRSQKAIDAALAEPLLAKAQALHETLRARAL